MKFYKVFRNVFLEQFAFRKEVERERERERFMVIIKENH